MSKKSEEYNLIIYLIIFFFLQFSTVNLKKNKNLSNFKWKKIEIIKPEKNETFGFKYEEILDKIVIWKSYNCSQKDNFRISFNAKIKEEKNNLYNVKNTQDFSMILTLNSIQQLIKKKRDEIFNNKELKNSILLKFKLRKYLLKDNKINYINEKKKYNHNFFTLQK